MSRKLDNTFRVYRELLDRYGELDTDVQQLKSELEVLESFEFRYPSRLKSRVIVSRTTGAHRRHIIARSAA
jgi:hypothetical protein